MSFQKKLKLLKIFWIQSYFFQWVLATLTPSALYYELHTVQKVYLWSGWLFKTLWWGDCDIWCSTWSLPDSRIVPVFKTSNTKINKNWLGSLSFKYAHSTSLPWAHHTVWLSYVEVRHQHGTSTSSSQSYLKSSGCDVHQLSEPSSIKSHFSLGISGN